MSFCGIEIFSFQLSVFLGGKAISPALWAEASPAFPAGSGATWHLWETPPKSEDVNSPVHDDKQNKTANAPLKRDHLMQMEQKSLPPDWA